MLGDLQDFSRVVCCVYSSRALNPCYTKLSHPSQMPSLGVHYEHEMKTLSLRMWDISLHLSYADYPEFMLIKTFKFHYLICVLYITL